MFRPSTRCQQRKEVSKKKKRNILCLPAGISPIRVRHYHHTPSLVLVLHNTHILALAVFVFVFYGTHSKKFTNCWDYCRREKRRPWAETLPRLWTPRKHKIISETIVRSKTVVLRKTTRRSSPRPRGKRWCRKWRQLLLEKSTIAKAIQHASCNKHVH